MSTTDPSLLNFFSCFGVLAWIARLFSRPQASTPRARSAPTNSPLAELAGRAVKSLSATVASASACGGRPAGFEHGVLANRDVGPKIRQLFDLAAANHGALDPLNLEVVVEAAAEAGASRSQLQTLAAAVEDLIGQPPLNGDAESLRAILLSASRYNLTDLAAAAQAALDALGP